MPGCLRDILRRRLFQPRGYAHAKRSFVTVTELDRLDGLGHYVEVNDAHSGMRAEDHRPGVIHERLAIGVEPLEDRFENSCLRAALHAYYLLEYDFAFGAG